MDDQTRITENQLREYPGMTRLQAETRANEILAGIAQRAKGIELPDLPNPFARAVQAKQEPIGHVTEKQVKSHSPTERKPVDEYQQALTEAITKESQK